MTQPGKKYREGGGGGKAAPGGMYKTCLREFSATGNVNLGK